MTLRPYVDLDGVLCDYVGGICRLYNQQAFPYPFPPGQWNFFEHPPLSVPTPQMAPKMDREFYANLDWTVDGRGLFMEIVKVFGEENVFLLTSPWDTQGSQDGKKAWVKKNLPGFVKRLVITHDKRACAFPGAVLFDDSDANCEKFRRPGPGLEGGEAVLVPRPWNSHFPKSCFATGRFLPSAAELVAGGATHPYHPRVAARRPEAA